MNKEKLLSRPEVAEILGIKVQTLAVWASTKRVALPYLRVGKSVRYMKSDVDQFINDCRVAESACS